MFSKRLWYQESQSYKMLDERAKTLSSSFWKKILLLNTKCKLVFLWKLPLVISSCAIRNGNCCVVKQPRLSCNHRANVADISRSEIKANRVRALMAVRHCSTGKIDMQIYAQILVILLTRPAARCNGSTGADGIHPLTPSPLSHLLSTQFLSLHFLSFFLSLSRSA